MMKSDKFWSVKSEQTYQPHQN